MYGFKNPIEEKREAEVNRTGSIVREKREEVDRVEGTITANADKIHGYREQMLRNNMELEVLGGSYELNAELQKRKIDLVESNKSFSKFISGLEGELPNLNHSATMAKKGLQYANNDFRDAKLIGTDSNGLTSNEKQKLQGLALSKMSFEDKKYWADRIGGIDKLKEIVPLI